MGDGMRLRQVRRLLRIAFHISTRHRWYSVAELAETFNVSRRTVRRDIIALQQIGMPVLSRAEQRDTIVEIPVYRLEKGWMGRFLDSSQ